MNKKTITLTATMLLLVLALTACQKTETVECYGEGSLVPKGSNLECCNGMSLIKPKEKTLEAAYEGTCTAKCGNGVCDSLTESSYNCPSDCEGVIDTEPSSLAGYEVDFKAWPNYITSEIENEGNLMVWLDTIDTLNFVQVNKVSEAFVGVGANSCKGILQDATTSGLTFGGEGVVQPYACPISEPCRAVWDLQIRDPDEDPAGSSNIYLWCSIDDKYLMMTPQQSYMNKYFEVYGR